MKLVRKGSPFFLALSPIIILIFLFWPSPSFQQLGRTLYVNNADLTCHGRSPCYTTIQTGVNASSPGDTIQIQAGSYPEKVTISGKNNTASATETDRITIEADPSIPPGSVVVTGATHVCTNGFAFRLQQSKFITMRGLIITGTGGQAIELLGGNNQNQAIHIERNRIFGNGSGECNGGITIARGNPDTLIVNNLIYANGRNGITFIDADGGPHYIVENTLHSNQWSGVNVARSHEAFLVNNIISQNGSATGSTGGRFGVVRESSTDPQPQGIHLLNNLICGNRLGEINGSALDGTDSGNLTPAGNEGPGVSASPGCQIPANVYANLNGPDGLANTGDDDFSLAVHSPAIDRGMDPRGLGLSALFNPIFESDFEGPAARPADGNADRTVAFDIGALELFNQRPIADAGPDQTAFTGAQVTLDGSHSHDPEGASLTYQWTIVSQPAGSTITLTNPTSATPKFTPLIAGSYVIQLIVNDGDLNSTPDTVVVTVVNPNQAPTANNATASTSEDTGFSITLTASDMDSTSLIFAVVIGPSHGSLGAVSAPSCVANAGGSNCTATVAYTPVANYNGTDSFTFRANDGSLSSNTATISITVNAINDAPTANNGAATTAEETPVGITLSASDVDSTALNFSIVSGPSHGSLNSSGGTMTCATAQNGTNTPGSSCTATVTYTPATNYNGPDSFTFRANDGSLDSNVATVSITVNAVNDAPVANDQSVVMDEDTAATIILSGSDIDNASLSLTVVNGPGNGTLGAVSTSNCAANGTGSSCTATVTYTPAANFNGTDTFTFKANDGSLDSNVATVSITVNAMNDAPVATDDAYNTDEDASLSVSAPGVLGNDNDLDDAQSTLVAVLVSGPAHAASFALNPDGSFTYTPAANFNGTDTFTYRAQDPHGAQSSAATVTIAINPVNDAPVATNDFYNTDEDTALGVFVPGVLANDNDIDTPQSSLTAILVAGPSHAKDFTLNSDGSFSYTPEANFNGTDSFTYKANDGSSDSNVAMVTIAINPVNDAPVADNDTYSTNEDATLTVDAPGVLGNDNDIDTPASSLTVKIVSGPTRATNFLLNADGSFSYTAESNFNGVDTFTYRVFDGALYSNVAMVQVAVASVNDAPAAQSQSVTTNEDTPVSITLSASDIDSPSLSFSIVANPSHGTLGIISAPNCAADGTGSNCTATVIYSPAAHYSGAAGFTFTASDGQATSSTATVSVTVNHINHAPTANAGGPYSGRVGIPIQFSGSGSDPDGDSLTFSWDFGDGSSGSGVTPTHTYASANTFTITLTVTDPFGAFAVSQTTATVTPAFQLNPIGNKTVNLGDTLVFTVTVDNPSGGPVSLFVDPLPLPNHATFNPGTGVFTFTPDTAQVGSFQLTFTVVSGDQSSSETITITVPNPPPGGTTAVRGLIYNLNQTPLGNVKVTLKSSGNTAFSGDDGFFTISGVPSGRQELIINGRGANLGVFAILAQPVDLIDGVLNNLANPITLPDVDVDAEIAVSPTFTTVISNPNVPGVELTIPGGTARNSDGTLFTGKLSINPVPDYGRPESRPEELRPGMAITIQPAGVRFNPPARLTFPNTDNMPAGSELNMWSLSPDTGTFSIVGKMVVSADGQSIITVEGGVVASAWHFPLPSAPAPGGGGPDGPCKTCQPQVGSQSDLVEGSLFLSHAIPSYRSLGQGRTLSLTYSSITAEPKPIVSLNALLSVRAAVPKTFSTRLEVGGVQQGGEIFTDTRSLPENSDSTSRISVQFDASNLLTARYPYKATIFSNYQNSSIGGIFTGNVVVLNRKQSPLGAGWAITELQQLYPQADGALVVSGDGTTLFFTGGPNIFTSPPDDFTTLVKNSDVTYTRTSKDGTKINFSAQGLQTSVVDRNNNTTSYGYDGDGRLFTVTDPAGLITTLAYSGGKLQRITDPAGRQTSFQYDSSVNLTRITNPDGTFATYAYDDKGHATQVTDERGNATTYAYDFAGRFTRSTKPTGETRAIASTRLQGLANLSGGQGTATNPAPVVQSQNATSSSADGQGNRTTFMLDSLGQVISQTDAAGNTTLTQRNSNGLPTKITRPNGAVTTITYDTKGNLLTSTDPVGAKTIFTYDPAFNQVKTIKDPKGNLTTINYDLNGNPIEIIDALGNRTQMAYDARGLLTSTTSAVGTPEQSTTSFTYDSKGNLLTTTDPLGNVTTLVYDNAGNVSRSTDAEGRATEFSYDAFNRLSTVLDPNGGLTRYTFDAKGNLSQVIDAKNQTTAFSYDSVNRLASATNSLGLTEMFANDANGNLISTTNRNGQTLTFNYDALNRLTSKNRPPTSTETGTQTTMFQYDSVGNLLSVVNPTIAVQNEYDLANRLVSSTSSTEDAVAGTVTQINVDTTITDNNFQFEGKTLQVNGKTLTVDGSHTFENLILVNGAVLTHSPTTATKVNKLDIKVNGTLQIDATSKIDVTGKGFLGGSKPGNPFGQRGMTVEFVAGSSGSSGGGYGGLGGAISGSSNPVYGDFRDPNEPGSGGATGSGSGGNGGGLVRIVAGTLQLDGVIRANGGNGTSGCCFDGGGSGGGIRIDAGTLKGVGQITANGGTGPSSAGGGGGGRVALYYQNIVGFDLSKVSAFGATATSAPIGGAGTVYLQGPSRETGELIVDNNNLAAPTLSTPIINPASGNISLMHFRVKRQAHVRLDSVLNLTGTLEVATNGEFISTNRTTAGTIDLNNTGVITHLPTTATTSFKVDLNANTMTIDATSRIDVNTLGFLGGSKPGNPFGQRGMTAGFVAGSSGSSGGGYGGLGGAVSGSSNSVYGDFRDPNEPGSGGATGSGSGGNGGGLVRIVAQNLILNGVIRANGGNGSSGCCFDGGGGGGGIRIDVGTLSGVGQITTNGGIGSGLSSAGGGGGGRVAIYYQDTTGFDLNKVSALGFTGSVNGGAGTVYLQGPNRETGELIIDNNNLSVASLSTPIISPPTGNISLKHFRVRRQARARVDSTLYVSGTLEVAANGEFISTNRTTAGTIDLNNTGVITHLPTTATTSFKVDLSANTMTIDATSRIDVNTLGFLGGNKSGNPFGGRGMTLGFVAGSSGSSGGSYGGLGGSSGGTANSVYGDSKDPNNPGSGGATGSGSGGTGGGLARIVAGTLKLNGVIRANGGNGVSGCCFDGGGSGGGIRIDVGTLSGTGTITVNGGNASPSASGGGGGGRVAVYYSDITGFDSSKIKALGGTGSVIGQNGTVFLQQTLAMITPLDGESPVMKAEAGSDLPTDGLIRLAFASASRSDAVPQRRVFSSDSVLSTQSSVLLAQNRISELSPNACCLTPSSDTDPIYSYDLNGNRISMIDPTGQTTYTYDALNRLTSITNNKGVVTTFSYDALGRRTSMTHGNGVVTSYTYDAASQLLSLAHKLGAMTINSFSYTYDKVGNRKTKVNRDGSHNYTYDTLNRLIEAINPLPTNPLENYTYDPVGNRTDSNQNGLSQFNVANELNEDGDFTYQYDNNGNMTRKTAKVGGAVTDYEYDAENKLVRVVMPGTTVDYKYDGLGRRVEKDVVDPTTTVTRYIYDSQAILLELDGSNNIMARYTHGPGVDEPLIMEKAGANLFYHADGLGSITEISNQSGGIVQRYSYSSFGEIASQLDANFVQPYTLTAREFDGETGLYFYRMRNYDWRTGRFVQEDPILHAGSPDVRYLLIALLRQPLMLNAYVYVDNKPTLFVDPMGLRGASGSWGSGASGSWTRQSLFLWNGNMWNEYTPQDWVCSRPMGVFNRWSCTEKCCIDHDACYRDSLCNWSSWAGNAFGVNRACQLCNSSAMRCIAGNIGKNDCKLGCPTYDN